MKPLNMDVNKWIRVSLFNLLLVALLGITLRYKIAFSLPLVDQKNLLHGHSHFAFSGWISQALMALVVGRMGVYIPRATFRRYNWILWANVICAYGMLISFPLQGYSFFSIVFSTLELVVSYIFMGYVWRDIATAPKKGIILSWFKAATFFNALSSAGALSLAFMMATKNMHQHLYLGSVYFFLHFQYNGWFMFTILGLLCEKLEAAGAAYGSLRSIFRLFLLACIPAYFLSALWMSLATSLYYVVVVAAIAQTAGWIWTMKLTIQKAGLLKRMTGDVVYNIIRLSMLAMSIKLVLQLGSTIPSLSKLAFGFRPIIIGYLHLVLLGVTSLFIIGYAFFSQSLRLSPMGKTGATIFIAGIVANEAALMIQGLAAMSYVMVPYINEVLLVISVIMFTGLIVVNLSQLPAFNTAEIKHNSGLAGTTN